jgi:hypothetical protein
MYKWKPQGKRKRWRPNKSWLEGIVTTMKNRGLTFEDAQDSSSGRWGREGGTVLYNPKYIYIKPCWQGFDLDFK